MSIYSVDPKELTTGEFHRLFLGVVAPRPIAFVSTVDEDGNVNLAPYSFFNAFSAKPPVMIFSPARRVRDNTTKHSLENVLKVPEVCVNIVSFSMVQQMSLASTEYAEGVNEFVKAGFTEQASELIQPPRVAEAPASFECKVREVISLGDQGGAGNLVVCEVLKAHFSESIVVDGGIDPQLLDAVGRMGGNTYVRAHGSALFDVAKPIRRLGIGIDSLPEAMKRSKILTGNDLGRLGNSETLPSKAEVQRYLDKNDPGLAVAYEKYESKEEARHHYAQQLLQEGHTEKALLVLSV